MRNLSKDHAPAIKWATERLKAGGLSNPKIHIEPTNDYDGIAIIVCAVKPDGSRFFVRSRVEAQYLYSSEAEAVRVCLFGVVNFR